MTVAEIILRQTPLPTQLDSETIRLRVAQRVREQAFFSAQMTLKAYLKDLQKLLAAYAEGKMDASEVRVRARSKLAELHYAPLTGGEGTLKDHRSPARLNLTLRTNVQMAASMAQRDIGEDPLLARAYPAWELVCGGYRNVHRKDWDKRWQAAGEAVQWQGALKGRRMIALKTSPIWEALGRGAGGFRDTLGNPYPPFAFGSSYEWSELSLFEAQEAGLLPKTVQNRKCQAKDPATCRTHGWASKPPKGSTLSALHCSRKEGAAFLQADSKTEAFDNRKIVWKRRLYEKYQYGDGRAKGSDPRRLELVKAAVVTTRYPSKVIMEYRGGQSFYYREFGDHAIAVFVDNATHEVNSFMKGSIREVRRSIGTKYF